MYCSSHGSYGKGILTQLTNYLDNYISIFATKQSTKMQQKFLNSWLHFLKKPNGWTPLNRGRYITNPNNAQK